MFKMECRSRAIPEQFAAMLKFMECHGDISRPQNGTQGRIKSDILWQELGELLNSVAGGVPKPIEKWKKVWADWKAKTKKKALGMRREGCGTAQSSKQTLSAFEQRVLGIIGFSVVYIQAELLEKGCDDVPSDVISLPPNRDSVQTEQSATNGTVLDLFSRHPIKASPSSSLSPPSEELPLTPSSVSVSTHAPAVEPVSSAVSPTGTMLRRRRMIEKRRIRTQTRFQKARSEFVAIEQHRLQLEEKRETLYHQREMERLQLESRRITMEENRNEVLSRLTAIIDDLRAFIPRDAARY